MKNCAKCKKDKDTSEFGKRSSSKDGLHTWCKLCLNVYRNNYNANNKEKLAARQRRAHLKREYGITPEEYDTMLFLQDGKCAICGKGEPGERFNRFHVDHNHVNGIVRGLLCGACNKGMGCFKDDPKLLRLAMEYLV
jgi:hypothetical protein